MGKQNSDANRHQHLPLQSTSFIGRAQDVAAIIDTLNDEHCRLLTLAGSGGAGKTRLAIAVAARKFEDYQHGVYFVSLQPLGEAKFIIPAIYDALDFEPHRRTSPARQLLDYLHDKQMLLILDNFEHVLDGAGFLSEILDAAPGIQLLITSREALNLREEWVHSVDGLPYPGETVADDADSYDAVQLFVERARQMQKTFDFAQDRACVIRICQLLDGMPLAIELAVSWLRALPCSAIAAEITRDMEFLATGMRNVPARHRSMRAVFEHSWKLLSAPEQDIFMKLSVFRGSFGRETAQVIAGANLAALSSLVEKSMIRINRAGRYHIHELVRQFAADQLSAAGIREQVMDVHSACFMDFLHARESDLMGRRQVEVIHEIEADYENIRAAWYRAVERRQVEHINRALLCLDYFLVVRTHWSERDTILQDAVDAWQGHGDDIPHPAWGKLLTIQAQTQDRFTVPYQKRRLQAERGLTTVRQHGSPDDEALCMLMIAEMGAYEPDFEQTKPYAEQCLIYYRAPDDRVMLSRTLAALACCYRQSRQYDRSIPLWQESCDLALAVGNKHEAAFALMHAGIDIYRSTGSYADTLPYWQEAYRLRVEIDSANGIVMSATTLSSLAILYGDYEEARQKLNEAAEVGSKVRGGWGEFVFWIDRDRALLALYDEDYEQARLHAEASWQTDYAKDLSETAIWLALADCGLEDYAAAREHLGTALQSINARCAPPFLTQLLPPAALLMAHDGGGQQAVQLLGLAFTFPGTLVGMMEDWALIRRLKDHLRRELDPDVYSAAWNYGAAQDLAGVIAFLHEYFADAASTPETRSAAQKLIEPLSDRELEVLRLVALGKSNRDIARELTLAHGTVKAHLHHILQKLDASSRTQAVARARDLHLL